MTEIEIAKLPTSEILALFNQATGRATTKFASRARGIEQTLRALRSKNLEDPIGPSDLGDKEIGR